MTSKMVIMFRRSFFSGGGNTGGWSPAEGKFSNAIMVFLLNE
jgi:hypothetical protein